MSFFHLGMLKSLLTPSPNAEHHLTMKGRWRIHVYWLVISNTFWLPDDSKSGQTHHQPDSTACWGISLYLPFVMPDLSLMKRSHNVTARFPLKSNACRKQLADTSSIFFRDTIDINFWYQSQVGFHSKESRDVKPLVLAGWSSIFHRSCHGNPFPWYIIYIKLH